MLIVMWLLISVELPLQDDDLALIVAQLYYVNHQSAVDPVMLKKTLFDYLPRRTESGNRTSNEWVDCITNALVALNVVQKQVQIERVKEKIVMYAQKKWALQFSGMFQVHQLSGPRLSKNNILIAINNRAFFIVEQKVYKSSPVSTVIFFFLGGGAPSLLIMITYL